MQIISYRHLNDIFVFETKRIPMIAGVNLKGSDLEGSNLGNVNLRVATLKGANLQNCNLRGAELAGADLEVRFIKAVISERYWENYQRNRIEFNVVEQSKGDHDLSELAVWIGLSSNLSTRQFCRNDGAAHHQTAYP